MGGKYIIIADFRVNTRCQEILAGSGSLHEWPFHLWPSAIADITDIQAKCVLCRLTGCEQYYELPSLSNRLPSSTSPEQSTTGSNGVRLVALDLKRVATNNGSRSSTESMKQDVDGETVLHLKQNLHVDHVCESQAHRKRIKREL